MADDNKSCHCEFVPQDLTPGLKVTIRAIWYVSALRLCAHRSSLHSLFICCFWIHIILCFSFLCAHPRVKVHRQLLGESSQSDVQPVSCSVILSITVVYCCCYCPCCWWQCCSVSNLSAIGSYFQNVIYY